MPKWKAKEDNAIVKATTDHVGSSHPPSTLLSMDVDLSPSILPNDHALNFSLELQG